MKVLKDSPFSWQMPTRVIKVRWCGRLVANYVSNLDIGIVKQSTELWTSLHWCGKHSTYDHVVRGIYAHVRSVSIHELVRVSRAVIAIPVEVFPLIWQWYPDYRIEGMPTHRIQGPNRANPLVWMGITIHLLSEDLILGLLSCFRVGTGGEWPTEKVGQYNRRSPSMNFLFISSFSFWRAKISYSFFLVTSSFLLIISAISLCRDINNVICSASVSSHLPCCKLIPSNNALHTNSLGPTVGANCSRTGLGPRELLRSLFSFLSWSVRLYFNFLPRKLLTLAYSSHLSIFS